MFHVQGLSALVTGAGTGIGRASAIALAEYGANRIILNGRRVTLLEETRQIIHSITPECEVIVQSGDVSDPQWRKKLTGEVYALGPLDILVNNAGVYHSTKFEDISDSELDGVIRSNLEAVFSLTRDMIPAMERSTYPCIINIGSTLSMRPIAQGAGYNIAKAAIDHLTRTLALELGPKRIRVNCVSPGIVETPMYRNRFTTDQAYREAIEQAVDWHPLGRVGTPEDVARAVVFLASPAASWITGVVLPVDGGLLTS